MDKIDRKILSLLQKDASATMSELAEKVGLSTTPLWKRVRRLEEGGIITGRVTLIDQAKIGLKMTGFVSVKTNDHSDAWLAKFASAVQGIPEIVEVYRMAGDIDYLLKVVAPDMGGYDAIYKRLIDKVALADVSASFSMEIVKETTSLPLDYAE